MDQEYTMIRIKRSTLQKLMTHARYGDTQESTLSKILNEREAQMQ